MSIFSILHQSEKIKILKNNATKRLLFGALIDSEALQVLHDENGNRTLIRDQIREGVHAEFPDVPPNEVDIYVMNEEIARQS